MSQTHHRAAVEVQGHLQVVATEPAPVWAGGDPAGAWRPCGGDRRRRRQRISDRQAAHRAVDRSRHRGSRARPAFPTPRFTGCPCSGRRSPGCCGVLLPTWDDAPHGTDLCVQDLARSLGIGERSGPNGPLPRTLKRCVDFEMAEWRESSLAVRRKLPPLARRHLRRLPDTLQRGTSKKWSRSRLSAPPSA